MSGALSFQPMCLVGEAEEETSLFSCVRGKFAIDHETSMDVLEENTSWVDQPVVVVDYAAPLVCQVNRVANPTATFTTTATTTVTTIRKNSSILSNSSLSTINTTPTLL